MNHDDDSPVLTRLRHETRRRSLDVLSVSRITPGMIRVRLGGADLAGFTSPSPSDHVKLFVPDGEGGTAMRDYTPRRFDVDAGWLEIDFALHDAGPATRWALQVQRGDRAEIGGPRGSQLIDGPIEQWLLIGDETALPSIARRIEELPAGASVTSIITVSGPEEAQTIETLAKHDPVWVFRKNPADPAAVLAALQGLPIGPKTFVWAAAEAGVARAVRDALLAKGVPGNWMRVAGYWQAGLADAAVKDL